MQINISFGGMIPLKKYTGPLLKLTKSEEDKISTLQSNINDLEIELYQLSKIYDGKNLTNGQANYYFNKVASINTQINELKEIIRTIKINRFNEQKKH